MRARLNPRKRNVNPTLMSIQSVVIKKISLGAIFLAIAVFALLVIAENAAAACPPNSCPKPTGPHTSNFKDDCWGNGQFFVTPWFLLSCQQPGNKWVVYQGAWGCDLYPTGVNSCVSLGSWPGKYSVGGCWDGIDPGPWQSCVVSADCPAGTTCSNKVCCPEGTCGYGDGVNTTKQCVAAGGLRVNTQAKIVCKGSAGWVVPRDGWGCDVFPGDTTNGGKQTCKVVDGRYFWLDTVTNPPLDPWSDYAQLCENGVCHSFVSTPYFQSKVGWYCAGTCVTCATAPGGPYNCGKIDNKCGSEINCGDCATGSNCVSGKCVPACDDDCAAGETKCEGTKVKTCGNYDADSCLEWGAATDCPAGQTCSGTACAPIELCTGTDNVFGWAWSENVGWISANCHSGGGAKNYGLNIGGDGTLTGYAWSENVGWISFEPADVNGCNNCSGAACQAKVDTAAASGNREITGWAGRSRRARITYGTGRIVPAGAPAISPAAGTAV